MEHALYAGAQLSWSRKRSSQKYKVGNSQLPEMSLCAVVLTVHFTGNISTERLSTHTFGQITVIIINRKGKKKKRHTYYNGHLTKMGSITEGLFSIDPF